MTRHHECPDCYGCGYRYYDVSIDPSARLVRDTCTTCDGEGFLSTTSGGTHDVTHDHQPTLRGGGNLRKPAAELEEAND